MNFSLISNLNTQIKSLNMMWQRNGNSFAKNIIENNTSKTVGMTNPEYLRENSPQIYNDAVNLAEEKKAYAKALSRCETRDDVRMLQMGKLVEALQNGTVSHARFAAMTKVYIKFTETREFAKLAANYLELADALKPEKEVIADQQDTRPVEENEKKPQTSEAVSTPVTMKQTTLQPQADYSDVEVGYVPQNTPNGYVYQSEPTSGENIDVTV